MIEPVSSKKSIVDKITYFFMSFINIFFLTFKGIKFIFIDLFLLVFNFTGARVNSTYRVTKDLVNDELEKQRLIEQKRKEKKAKYQAWYNNLVFVKKRNEKLEKIREALLIDLENEGSKRSPTPKVYQYTARNSDGEIETGTINGFSKLDVNTYLLQENYIVYDIKTSPLIDFLYGETSLFAVKMSNKDLLFWLTQLSTYLKSGIPLTEGVKILNKQMQNKRKYSKALKSVVYELTLGESFSKALEKQGSMFPALLINMIKAAEATGELEETLTDMADYYSEIEKTRRQMISAITYPTTLMIFAVGVITFILLYVIPQFIEIYKKANIEMDGLTSVVVSVSDFLTNNIDYAALIIVLVCITIMILYKRIKAFRREVQYILMHMPLIGNVMIYNELTIFTKTFASLLANNVFITDSMALLGKITNNEIYKEIMSDTIDNIVKGGKISTSFKDQWAVPEVAYYMIVTGESTGQLSEMMKKVSDYYAEMHRSIVTNLKSFIEPILIAFLAIVVGLIIFSVLIPMFGMLSNMQN